MRFPEKPAGSIQRVFHSEVLCLAPNKASERRTGDTRMARSLFWRFLAVITCHAPRSAQNGLRSPLTASLFAASPRAKHPDQSRTQLAFAADVRQYLRRID